MADNDNITWTNLSGLLSGSSGQTAQPSGAPQASGFDAQSQKNLDSLQPDFADRAKQWVQGMRSQGFDPVINYGYRTPEEQQTLYQKYLAGGNKAVAPPYSYHTYGRAFDWVNRNPNGNLEWENDAAYSFGQKLAKQYGLTGISGDNDHIQDARYNSWRDLPREEYGNVAPRQVAQTTNAPATTTAALQTGGNYGGVSWANLSGLLQR
jgi:hypothetical protein